MAMTINTNVVTLNAQRHLMTSQNSLATSMGCDGCVAADTPAGPLSGRRRR